MGDGRQISQEKRTNKTEGAKERMRTSGKVKGEKMEAKTVPGEMLKRPWGCRVNG